MITLSPKNPMRVVLLSVLAFEVIVFGLAIPVMIFIGNVPAGQATGFAGGAAVLALVGVAMLRRPGGYLIGWLTQLVGVALGFLISTMFIVGIMFTAIWVISFVLGKRLDNRPQQA